MGPDDIARLYGERIYIIRKPGESMPAGKVTTPTPEEREVIAAVMEQSSLTDKPAEEENVAPRDPAITWMLRNDSPKVIFMIPEKEFTNKPLTELLRKIVVASQVATEDTGFGIIKGKPVPSDFDSMPAPYGFFLDESLNPFGSSPVMHEGKQIWFAKRLGQMAKDDTLKAELWKMMKEFMQKLRGS